MKQIAFFTIVVSLVTLTAPHAIAQVVRGQLVDQSTGTPIGGGFVVLIDPSENELSRAPTDANGRFTIR